MEELKHGYWIPVKEQHGSEAEGYWTESFLQCSLCQYKRRVAFIIDKPNFCEECGADMRGAPNE